MCSLFSNVDDFTRKSKSVLILRLDTEDNEVPYLQKRRNSDELSSRDRRGRSRQGQRGRRKSEVRKRSESFQLLIMNELPDFLKSSVLRSYQPPRESALEGGVLLEVRPPGGQTSVPPGSDNGKEIKWNNLRRKIRTCNTFLRFGKSVRIRSSEKPLVRFRRVVKTVQVLLRATLTNRQTHRTDAKYLSWAHDDFSSSKRTYEMFGLSFDPNDYRAKKEVYLSNEAKLILSMDPRDRTDDHLKVALLALNTAVEAFGEFPITMQRSLVRVGWYECFEDKRVIIRQGHMADNFYFILSGTAVVTILETDPETKDQLVRTAALLGKGNSFGELALMHGAKRSATVTCKNSVELLAVGRDDFIDIFMPVEKDQEPEHIRFLRSVILLKGWPIVRLPYHDPKICCFTYFRRGLLLCKDSNTSEWVYVIKTGTCRVLKALQTTRPNIPGLEPNLRKTERPLKLPPITQSQSVSSSSTTPTSSIDWGSPRSPWNSSSEGHIPKKFRKCTTETMANLFSKKSKEERLSTADHKRRIDRVYEKTHANNFRRGKERLPSMKDLESIPSSSELNRQQDTVFVQIQKLGPKETYGLEQVAFGMIGKTTSTILVSEGAECILINRKFFKQYLTDEEAKRIRHTLQPIPSEESLQQKLQDKTNWEAYKALTVVTHLLYKRQEENNASLFY